MRREMGSRELGHEPAHNTAIQAHMGDNPGDADSNKKVFSSSRSLNWPGIFVQSGAAKNYGARDLSVPFVLVAMNAGAAPFHVSWRADGRTTRHVVAPGAIWIQPDGMPMTISAHGALEFIDVLFDPTLLTHLSGHDQPVSFGLGMEEPPLTHLIHALSEEARLGNPNGPSFERMLTTAIAGYLARRFTVAPMHVGAERLTPAQKRRALEYIEHRLDVGATLEDIAAQLRLSPFHFARAFRNAVGMSPHAFLIERRLQRASEALAGGCVSVSEAAAQFGFADRCHFARLFRRRYGEPPSALVRRRGR